MAYRRVVYVVVFLELVAIQNPESYKGQWKATLLRRYGIAKGKTVKAMVQYVRKKHAS